MTNAIGQKNYRILTPIQVSELRAFIAGQDLPCWLYEWADRHFAGEIPYGILNGDEGDVGEWLGERIDEVEYYFSDCLKGAK